MNTWLQVPETLLKFIWAKMEIHGVISFTGWDEGPSGWAGVRDFSVIKILPHISAVLGLLPPLLTDFLRKLELELRMVPSSRLQSSTLERKDPFPQFNNARKSSNQPEAEPILGARGGGVWLASPLYPICLAAGQIGFPRREEGTDPFCYQLCLLVLYLLSPRTTFFHFHSG